MISALLRRGAATLGAITLAAAATVAPASAAVIVGTTTWTAQNSTTKAGLDSVSFVDCNNGWAVGESSPVGTAVTNAIAIDRATIVHTSNGGQTWARQATPVDAHLDRVVFVDAMHGWSAGEETQTGNGVLIYTADGGVTWKRDLEFDKKNPQKIDGLWFTDLTHGFVGETNDENAGARIFQTTNGGGSVLGGTWTTAFTATNANPLDLEGLHAFDSTHVVAIGERSMVRLKNGTWANLKKANGDPWTTVTLASVFFVSATRGWAVGHQNELLFTDDGGTTWTEQRTGTEQDPDNLDIRFYDQEHGYFVGTAGRIFRTANHGLNWIQETTPNATSEFEGLSAPNSARAWAVGNNGTILFRKGGAPFVSGISPSSGPDAGGTKVVITGCGFTGATGVSFGFKGATFTVNSDTQITATSPPQSGGQPVTVTNNQGTSAVSAATTFTYIPAAAPKLPKAGYTSTPIPNGAAYLLAVLLVLPLIMRAAVGVRRRRG